jgi:hypothetical protein
MKQLSKFILLLVVLIIPSLSFAFTFIDDFNDGNLAGWTPKSGDWSNPGDFLLSSYNQYGVIWKDGSFGYNQTIKIDAYFDDATLSKSAQLRLRSGNAGFGPNPYWDHGYIAGVISNNYGNTYVSITNAVAPYHQALLAVNPSATKLSGNSWHTIEFTVSGLGYETHLELWIDGELYLEANDTSGYAHDDGGYIALGSSNHINRRISYDNAEGYTQSPVVHLVTVLENTVASLDLPKAVENSYDANLKKVGTFIEIGKLNATINNLQAFIHKVEIDIAKGKITAADGNALIAMATDIINLLSP